MCAAAVVGVVVAVVVVVGVVVGVVVVDIYAAFVVLGLTGLADTVTCSGIAGVDCSRYCRSRVGRWLSGKTVERQLVGPV